ncbi:MAG: hypothetical protein ABIQ98_05375 [Sphingomicrobium sp.]
MTLKLLSLLILSSLCASAGTLLLKAGATGRIELVQFVNLHIAGGLALYAMGSIFWIFVMASQPLSIVYPCTALTFVLVLLGSYFFQGDRPQLINLLGVVLILAGVGLVMWRRVA